MNFLNRTSRKYLYAGFSLLLLLSGCIQAPKPTAITSAMPYLAEQGNALLNRYAPVFWIEEHATDHNRIGAGRATTTENIFIDPDTPVIYAEQRQFTTAKGTYTNLIYRVHFQEIPSGFLPYYLGAGKNVGLLLVLTLNAEDQPLLITSVHTCGCYLAFIPTSYLPQLQRPKDWNAERQTVFSENLPASLDYAESPPNQRRIQIRIRPDTHRVMDVWLAAVTASPETAITTRLHPLDSLQHLPLAKNKTTSFYETSGSRAGYVKGSYKMRERLWMSWWALDWNIGQDKYFGKDKQDGPVFYTSLKPWAREASDMRDFPKFLEYWGWDL